MEATLLPVPHISQLGLGADHFRNDCGAACAAMLIKAYTGKDVTPNQLFAAISPVDRYLRVDELKSALDQHGLQTTWQADNHLIGLFGILMDGRPVIALISYAPLVDAGLGASSFRGSHFVVVVGMDIRHVYILDPLRTDHTPLAVPIATWMCTWTEVAAQGNPACGWLAPTAQLEGAFAVEMAHARVTCDVLNVRSGPGVGHPSIGVLREGDVIQVLEKRGEWIRHGENRWSYGQYLSELQ